MIILTKSHLDQGIGHLVVQLLGGLLHGVGSVEGKQLGGLIGGRGPLDEALALVGVQGHHGPAAQRPLPAVQGPAADHHLHRLGAGAHVEGYRSVGLSVRRSVGVWVGLLVGYFPE